ncbi:velvet factor-domain-containing protein [Irpex rosettiformis]|uniref:Velvet factor-domain-containing protein n=1 Tax=Irpex rosettiformis TaxID=378272 RepID=A0ACB8TR89_9APHY|nr:velvet factor-domain-containing protein [Irpex rosettiformis]
MPEEQCASRMSGPSLLSSSRVMVDRHRTDYSSLVIERRMRHLPTVHAKSHRLTYTLSVPPTRQLGVCPYAAPRTLSSRSSLVYSRRAAQFHASEPSSTNGSKAEFGYQRTRNPPTRSVPQWQSPTPSLFSSGLPRLHLPAELPKADNRLYRLEIVQHPLKAAEFGLSPLTRLPLAPPLIAQLHYRDRSTPDDMDGNDFPFLIAHIALYNADGSSPVDVIGPGGQTPSQQRLYGNLVSSPQTLRNLQGRLGVYFLFPDVSIRWSGRFTLSVTLMRIPRVDPTRSPINIAEQGVVLAQARSHVFDVYSREEYVAPAQTPLTQYFLQQGVRMYAFASNHSVREMRR